MSETEKLLQQIRDELRKTTSTLESMLREFRAYAEFRKAQRKQKV